MSYTFSKTWVSPETQEFETWTKIRDNISRISPRSPIIPKTFAEWLEHRVAMKEDQLQKVTSRIQEIRDRPATEGILLFPILGGRIFEDQLAVVLAQRTIWRPSLEPPPGRHLAPWPSYEEYKHEGDDRNKSGYSRFLPLPRDQSNVTVNWKQRKPLAQFPFDEARRWITEDDEGENDSTLHEPSAAELIGTSLLLLLEA